ncbi:hypothetical protein FisN_14Hh229 [Fistulifera solaris]|uniref:Uncharacterized protein n=1 Tax=Fistulifera solaris TaxID=1519565 RepID=A0A1Z5K8R0_FISSO|nr:hypothetical protein FisN_14Hh229 [Fistulifera solaris]|eukprot:GAX22596.1 hypothetical protein FisN_14Hh229 [Fistulifera solaris]
MRALLSCFLLVAASQAFQPVLPEISSFRTTALQMADSSNVDRRKFLLQTIAASAFLTPLAAQAIGPVRISLTPTSYIARTCPPNKPIPGQKAMQGMRGLCVTVQATLNDPVPKELEKVGVYGFITDGDTGDSVLANNPDLSTDAGQFAIVEKVKTTDKTIEFEFIAAVPREKDLTQYDNGIGPLNFESLRLVSFPGGQQYGEINPCEMNEFSTECEEWEEQNGPYTKGKFMMESNSRTKGR